LALLHEHHFEIPKLPGPYIPVAWSADARAKMTAGAPAEAKQLGADAVRLCKESEQAREDGENEVVLVKTGGTLAANLQIGADLTSCVSQTSPIRWFTPAV
jgi:hypothetical protein